MPTEPDPVAPGLFRLGADGAATLLGGRCLPCGRTEFPRPAVCPRCLEPMEEIAIGGHGTVYSYTIVRTRAPLGLPEPYAVAYVDLDGSGARVFALFDPAAVADLRIGARVQLEVVVLGHDGRSRPCLRPVFTPAPERSHA
jgi:uncharacterized OB-fold protein